MCKSFPVQVHPRWQNGSSEHGVDRWEGQAGQAEDQADRAIQAPGYEADIRQVCGHEGQSNEVADQGSGHEGQSQDKDGHEVCGDEVYREAPESGAILWLAKAQACPLNVLVAWAGPI